MKKRDALYLFAVNFNFGNFRNPYAQGQNAFGSGAGTGFLGLLNNFLRVIFLIAGLYAIANILMAGLMFIDARGDAKKVESAWYKIWQSLVGLMIVVASFIAAVVIGQVFFGNPNAILNPQITGPK